MNFSNSLMKQMVINQVNICLVNDRKKWLGLQNEAFLLTNRHGTLNNLSCLMRKLTMWFPNRSDTNQTVQSQKQARSLKFRI